MTINGKTFNNASSVTINGVAATFTVDTSIRIRVTVPSGATTGKIRVTTPGGTATSATNFTVLSTVAPTVDGIVRDFPADGTPDVTIGDVTVEVLASVGGQGAPPMAERGILEFGLAGVTQPVVGASLVLPVWASLGPFPFQVDVYGYAGDGLLTLTDWSRGTLITSFQYSGEQTVTIDVTQFLSTAIANGYAFAGFNLRFSVPSPIPVNGPFIALRSLELPPSATLRVD